MPFIETWIDISASASRVWEVFTCFEEYPTWNPFITSLVGVLQQGTKLRVKIKPPGKSEMTFKPTVMASTQAENLTWLGHLLFPGLFDGEHTFRIEDRNTVCRFHQSERFSGILVPLFGSGLLDATRSGFEAMNAALKKRAEA